MRGNKQYYSLECSTSLLNTKKLQFEWYQNETLISSDNPDFEQVLHQPLSAKTIVDGVYSTELIFKNVSSPNLNALYTCSLVYKDETINITKNETYIYRSKGKKYMPFYFIMTLLLNCKNSKFFLFEITSV